MYSVLIVEDDDSIRDKIEMAVQRHSELCIFAAVSNYADADRLLADGPDVLLVDLGLPDGDGSDLIRKAGQLGHIESIVITVFGDERHAMQAIEAGASGYLLKSEGIEPIGIAIVDMLRGD